MKKNEWKESAKTARQRIDIEPNRRCKNCGTPLDFADVRCPECGADAHVRKNPGYEPVLKTEDIQPKPRRHENTGPQTASIDNGWNTLGLMSVALPVVSIFTGLVTGYLVGSEKTAMAGLVIGLLVAVGLWMLSLIIIITAKNIAIAAENSEKEVANTSFIIRQLNELLDNSDEDNEINDQNAEEFAKMMTRIIHLNEQQLGKCKGKHRHAPVAQDAAVELPEPDEDELPEPAEDEIPEPTEEKPAQPDEPEETAQPEAQAEPEKEEAGAEEPVNEPEPAAQPEIKPEKKQENSKNGKNKKKVMELFEEAETEEAAQEQMPEQEAVEPVVEEPELEDDFDDMEADEEFDEEEEIISLACPHCDAVLERTISQLAGGTVACDVCGGMFKVEIDEDDGSDDWDAENDYNDDGFFDGKGDISRLDSIFDDK